MVGRSHAIPCPGCGYDLRASTNRDGARCPECGGRFTWPELGTPRLSWVMHRADRIMFWCAIGPGLAGVIGLLLSVVYAAVTQPRGNPGDMLIVLVVGVGLLWLVAFVMAGWIGARLPLQAHWSLRAVSGILHVGLILLSNVAIVVTVGALFLIGAAGAF